MENKEPSPVKLINGRCLEIKPYNCILRCPGEKGIPAFVTAPGIRGACNNFGKSAYNDIFDCNNNTLENNEVSVASIQVVVQLYQL